MQYTTTVGIASYGYSNVSGEGDVLTKQVAEQIAAQANGKIISNPTGVLGPAKQFRVLSARIEGTDEQGCVLATCEAVTENEEER
jgi:hypothetical protein